ncbi:MAG: alcohol dehydrogenase catalytic domain-containing protein [Chloroflexi bacterium]|nr:alcohol dehydrogenase catalytic domain-containing protein [Chloroflexota bacterium]
MKALVLEEPGPNPRLALKEVPTPALGPHDVLVQVAACGLCYHDVLVMRGVLRRGVKPQVVLGHEISGVVEEVGQLVTSLSPGDRVASILTEPCGNCVHCRTGREHRCLRGVGIGHGADGGFAQYARVSELALVPLPESVDLQKACVFGCPMGVALHALRDAGGLRAGETALVTGAGGGLGVHAVQLARALGARVLAVTTSEEKVEQLRSLGADEVLFAPDLDFGEVALALTEDYGCHLVLNPLGAIAFKACWTALAQFGRMALVGDVQGGTVTISPAEVLFKDARIIGVSGTSRQHLADVARMVQLSRVQPVVSQTFPLEAALEACQAMLEKRTFGRVALVPG